MDNERDAKRLLEAAEWLVRLDSGDSSQADLEGWAAWCRGDKENFVAYERLETLWREARLRPVRDPELLLASQSREPRDDRGGRSVDRRWPAQWRGMLFVASLAAIALIAIGTVYRPTAQRQSISERLTSRIAQNFEVALGDGSEITLGGESTVNVEFSRRQRLVVLQAGEVYVRDSHIADWPFVVRAGSLEIVALGTSFDVERSADQVVLSVIDGTVSASLVSKAIGVGAPMTEQRESVQMGVGERLVATSNGQIRILRADPSSTTSWMEGRLVYSGTTLADILVAVNRYSDRPIVVLDPRVAALRFTGTVFLQSIDSWIDSLPSVFPIKVEASPERIVLAFRPAS